MQKFNPPDILAYWFGISEKEAADATTLSGLNWSEIVNLNHHRWYAHGHKLDKDITHRFSVMLQQAENASDIEIEEKIGNAQDSLAIIILLDQFSRHIYRGSQQAFKNDIKSRAICLDGLDKDIPSQLPAVTRTFYFLPLEHSENLEDQQLAVKLYEQLLQHNGESSLHQYFQSSLDYAKLHHDIIFEFGRFPHRNHIMQRLPTKAEITYLNSGNPNFGQG